MDIPLRRVGSTRDAGLAILAVVSPLFAYVSGQVSRRVTRVRKRTNSIKTVMVSLKLQMYSRIPITTLARFPEGEVVCSIVEIKILKDVRR